MLVEIFRSKRGVMGNVEWAVRSSHLGDTLQQGTMGTNNMREGVLNARGVEVVTHELPIREFHRLVKGWVYAGSQWEEIDLFLFPLE